MKIFTFLCILLAAAPAFAADSTDATKLEPKVVSAEVLRAKPQARYLPDPAYPAELKKRGVGGSAKVQFVITAKGETTNVKILEASHPAFGVAAREAVTQAKFTPAVGKNGEPVSVQIEVPFTFNPNK